MNKEGLSLQTCIALLIGLIALPWLLSSAGDAWLRIMNLTLLYILLAIGLNVVVGFTGLLDLGYIAFYALGAYSYALLCSPHLGEQFLAFATWQYQQLPLGIIILFAGALAAGLGSLLGAPTLKLRGDYLAIVTLGFGEIIRLFLNNMNAPINITNGPQGILHIEPLHLFGHSLNKPIDIYSFQLPSLHSHYYLFLMVTCLAAWIAFRLQYSGIGRAWMAIREDEIAAKSCGICTRNFKLLAFAVGACFGGVAGVLFAGFQGFVSPESFGLNESILIIAMVVLGGIGHIPGVILGAFILSVLPEILRHGAIPAQHYFFGKTLLDAEIIRSLLFGITIIAVMLIRPTGLWPTSSQTMSRQTR